MLVPGAGLSARTSPGLAVVEMKTLMLIDVPFGQMGTATVVSGAVGPLCTAGGATCPLPSTSDGALTFETSLVAGSGAKYGVMT